MHRIAYKQGLKVKLPNSDFEYLSAETITLPDGVEVAVRHNMVNFELRKKWYYSEALIVVIPSSIHSRSTTSGGLPIVEARLFSKYCDFSFTTHVAPK